MAVATVDAGARKCLSHTILPNLFLENGHNRRLARIKTEQIIRDDYMIETLEIMEVYFNLLVSRFGLIEANKYGDDFYLVLYLSLALALSLCCYCHNPPPAAGLSSLQF